MLLEGVVSLAQEHVVACIGQNVRNCMLWSVVNPGLWYREDTVLQKHNWSALLSCQSIDPNEIRVILEMQA